MGWATSLTEAIFHQNYDLKMVVTPVKIQKLVKCLQEAGYNPDEIEFLQQGFTNGLSADKVKQRIYHLQ